MFSGSIMGGLLAAFGQWRAAAFYTAVYAFGLALFLAGVSE
jgi:hypothetical protein